MASSSSKKATRQSSDKQDTTRIRLSCYSNWEGAVGHIGDELDVPTDVANRLIKAGGAVKLVDKTGPVEKRGEE